MVVRLRGLVEDNLLFLCPQSNQEYITASEATREDVWLRRLLDNFGTTQILPTLLRCDKESAIGLAYNPLAHKDAKHIEVRYHYIREQVADETIVVLMPFLSSVFKGNCVSEIFMYPTNLLNLVSCLFFNILI